MALIVDLDATEALLRCSDDALRVSGSDDDFSLDGTSTRNWTGFVA